MRTAAASLASGDNEDWFFVSPRLVVVVDGATARTDTGCVHGVAWYAARLGAALADGAADAAVPLDEVLAAGIRRVAARHPRCDLTHPGTPSAAVGVVRLRDGWADYLVLGDVSIVLDTVGGTSAVCDERVSRTAAAERRAADGYPIGSAGKEGEIDGIFETRRFVASCRSGAPRPRRIRNDHVRSQHVQCGSRQQGR